MLRFVPVFLAGLGLGVILARRFQKLGSKQADPVAAPALSAAGAANKPVDAPPAAPGDTICD